MKKIILTDQAKLTKFFVPGEMESTMVAGVSTMPLPGRSREEFSFDATVEIDIRSTFGKKARIAFDLNDGRTFIDIQELFQTLTESFMESKDSWEDLTGKDVKRYRLVLEEIK